MNKQEDYYNCLTKIAEKAIDDVLECLREIWDVEDIYAQVLEVTKQEILAYYEQFSKEEEIMARCIIREDLIHVLSKIYCFSPMNKDI